MSTFEERRKARTDRMYEEVRAADDSVFRQCVQSAESIGMNHQALYKLTDAERSAVLADVEAQLVALASRLLP